MRRRMSIEPIRNCGLRRLERKEVVTARGEGVSVHRIPEKRDLQVSSQKVKVEVTPRDIRRINVHLFSPWKVVYKSCVRRFGGGLYRINMLCNLGFLLSIHFDFFKKSYEIFFIESPAFTAFFL